MPKRNFAEDPGNADFRIRMGELVRDCGGIQRLSKLSGVSHSSIRTYLYGSEPSRPVLCALAEAGGISIDKLARGKDSPTNDTDFAQARMVVLEAGNQWREGDVLAKFHRNVVKVRFKGANPDALVLVEASDHFMRWSPSVRQRIAGC
jgi:transcriptional regulator with XRE-family HTH domain